jgi:hypothetical protein
LTVDLLAPDTLYYVNGNDINASGLIQVYDILENTEIDVEKEIVGKKTYKMTNGYELSNGMKLDFQGTVTPAKYAEGNWYVEGVGDEIRLINEQEIEVPGTVSTNKSIPFDSESFDRAPFSNANAWAKDKDYIIQNRASPSKSQWSRYNRWFHKDVLETIALINKQPSDVNQTGRAARPIIEFDSGLKLWNFGTSVVKVSNKSTLSFADVPKFQSLRSLSNSIIGLAALPVWLTSLGCLLINAIVSKTSL